MVCKNTDGDLVIIAFGANLPSSSGSPIQTLNLAVRALGKSGHRVVRRSSWYHSAPEPPSAQPWFVNGVVGVDTAYDPVSFLKELLRIERQFGRRRDEANAARTLDLDLIDFRGAVDLGDPPPILPHPRAHERAFVLVPIAEIAPHWRHPLTGVPVRDLIRLLPGNNTVERIP